MKPPHPHRPVLLFLLATAVCLPAIRAGDQWRIYQENTSGLRWLVPAAWQTGPLDGGGSGATFSGAAGTDAYHTTLNAQLLDRAAPANADIRTGYAKLLEKLGMSGAQIIGAKPVDWDGIPGAFVKALVPLEDGSFVFDYLLLEREKVLVLLSWVCPAGMDDDYNPLREHMMMSVEPIPAEPPPPPEPPKPVSLEQLQADEAAARAALAKEADSPGLRKALATARARLGIHWLGEADGARALPFLLSATALVSDNPAWFEALGDACYLVPEPAAQQMAAEAYGRAVELSGNDTAPAAIKWASTLMTLERWEEARAAWERVITARGVEAADYMGSLAAVCLQLDKAADGIAFCEKMRKSGGDVRFMVVEAILRRGMGEPGAALALLDNAAGQAEPGSPMAGYIRQLKDRYTTSAK